MKIQHLKEGQENQIRNLHTRSTLRLYMPLSVDEAFHVMEHGLSSIQRHQGEAGSISRMEGFPVTHSLRHAMERGDIVLQFNDIGGHLAAPAQFNNTKMHELGTEHYPESQMPVVSLLLLNHKEPWVEYHSILPRSRIDMVHLTGYDLEGRKTPRAGVNDSLSRDQFETWVVNSYQKMAKTGRGGGGRKKSPFTDLRTDPKYWKGTPERT